MNRKIYIAILNDMIDRDLSNKVLEFSNDFPAIAIVGPRQSGKTTLVQHLFQDKSYVSLEDLDNYEFANQDPKGFLDKYKNGAILDEVQRCPSLFNYLQSRLDQTKTNGLFILSGSSQFTLNQSISQSLAGRVGILQLLPLSINEYKRTGVVESNVNNLIFNGFYPRIIADNANSTNWLNSYIQTYVEKDIRQLLKIIELDKFRRFISLCAGNVGSLLNLNRIANDCAISPSTATNWLTILKTSFICFTVQPHHENFRKRIVKTPKIYFYDTGLACRFLGIQNADQLDLHPMKGHLFENLVLADLFKEAFNQATQPQLYFWRDQTGLEIDIIHDTGLNLKPLEVKSGKTFNTDWVKSLKKFDSISKDRTVNSSLCFDTPECYTREGVDIVSHLSMKNWFQKNS